MRLKVMSLLCLSTIFAAGPGFTQTKGPLTNEDVLQMLKAGFDESMTIKAINANDTNFDTSAQGLVALKNAGVSQAIIEAMLDAKRPKSGSGLSVFSGGNPTTAEAKASPAEPAGLPNAFGLFYKASNGWIQLEALPAASTKTKGWGKAIATDGISGFQIVNVYKDAKAPVQISEARPTFYVRYPGLGSGRSVVLVRMDKKKDHRELQITQGATAFTTSMGFRQKDIVEFTLQPITQGLYTLTPKTDLAEGEYMLRVAMDYDFGIKLRK